MVKVKFVLINRSIFRTCGLIITLLVLMVACSRPDFHFIDGSKASIDDYKGRWLVINYWAEWCKPCIDEVPELNRFHEQMNNSVSIVSISFDKVSNQALEAQVVKYGIEYPVIATAPKPAIDIPMPAALPANYFVAPDGKRYGPVLGPHTAESLAQKVKAFEVQWLSEKTEQ